MKKALLLAGVMITGFVGGVIALQLDPVAELGRLRMLSSGIASFFLQTNASAQVEMRTATDIVSQVWDDGTGQSRLLSQPRLYFSTAAPAFAGALAYNETDFIFCKSTGTGPGAWVNMASSRTVTTVQVTASPVYTAGSGAAQLCW